MGHVFYAGLAFVAGLGVPALAAMSGILGARMGTAFLASAITLLVGGAVVLCVFAFAGPPRGGITWPWPTIGYAAGLFSALYIIAITLAAPRIGVANAVFLVILGQLVSAGVIDHFGLFGAPQVPMSWKRAGGVALMAVGVFLARRPV
ncbi:DMT family transporter [Acuticoccus sp.]|uniref:DMT family transporter n=1 Tax=Acuticoccus sp. TaxID=1904378 RepID=UPI003B52BDB1